VLVYHLLEKAIQIQMLEEVAKHENLLKKHSSSLVRRAEAFVEFSFRVQDSQDPRILQIQGGTGFIVFSCRGPAINNKPKH